MGQVLVDSDSLTAIGDAIRKKTNQVIKYKPAEMPAAINNINSLKLGGYKVNKAITKVIDYAILPFSRSLKTDGDVYEYGTETGRDCDCSRSYK